MMLFKITRVAAALLITSLTQRNLQPFAKARLDKETEVKRILQRIEEDTLKLRDEIEAAYGERCNIETLSQCSRSSFNGCSSVFPNQQCMEADELVIEACRGEGGTCNALWDKTTSVVSIPSALTQGEKDNPTDPELIETACYSLLAEDYMRQKYEEDEIFWDNYGAEPSAVYFGGHNGLFRKLPATMQEECGNYDPRKRPWFVAASSGPKDVVIVLDISGSMSNHNRLDLAKKSAITVVETLTISDRVAVVAFSDYAYQVHSGTDLLVRATNENKKLLIESIQQLTEGGATNFHAGFQVAFDALERTIRQESTSGCNVAILFMTDGVNTAGPDTDETLTLINKWTRRLANLYDRDTKIFTFSLGTQADRVATKKIACSTNGIWTPVDDFDDDLVSAMSSYYKLFSNGLGDDTNFSTAWVEPYEFFTAKKMGTTNSAPVFDRSVDPPLFLGVVANDVYLDAFEQILGEDARSSTMLQRFVRLSTAKCPKIDLSECQLEYLRYLAGGKEATCGICNPIDYPGIVPKECPLKPDLPTNLWHNTDLEGLKYSDRACCEIGSNVPSETCYFPDDNGDSFGTLTPRGMGLLFAVAISGLCFLCCCGAVFWKCYKQMIPQKTRKVTVISLPSTPAPAPAAAVHSTNTVPVASAVPSSYVIPGSNGNVNAQVAYGGVNAMMPPSASAPPMNPAFHIRS